MNYPTREEFEQLKEQFKRLEQRTEEMKVVKIEVASEDALKHLNTLEHGQQKISRKQDEQFDHLKEELESILTKQNEHAKGLLMHSRSVSALQDELKDARADILAIRASQSDFKETLLEVKNAMVTKDDITSMATKDDIKRLETDITSIKTTQEQILALLKQNRPES